LYHIFHCILSLRCLCCFQAVLDQIKTLEAEVQALLLQGERQQQQQQQQQQQLQVRHDELAAAKAAALAVLQAAVLKRKRHEAEEHPDGESCLQIHMQHLLFCVSVSL
jgi:hypothetical protein